MYDDVLIIIGVACFALLTVLSSTFFHELGHFFAAKTLRVSVKNIVFVSTLPRVNYQDPGEPIKDGLAYCPEAPRAHQNIILLAGPFGGLLAAVAVYFIFQTYPDNPVVYEIHNVVSWLADAIVCLPVLMFVANILPIRLGERRSDGYHVYYGPTKP